MKKNVEIDFKELERLSQFGGSDSGEESPDVAISPIVSATVKYCLPAISGVTTLFSCNRSCGWGSCK